MDREELNSRIISTGGELFRAFEGEAPSLFERERWVGKMMGWSLRHDEFRTAMLRFVDVFPALSTSRAVVRHLGEYFHHDDPTLPASLRIGLNTASHTGALGAAALGAVIRMSIKKLGAQFIAGGTARKAVKAISKIRQSGCAFSLDNLGEAVLSEEEAEQYASMYLSLLDNLARAAKKWTALGGQHNSLDWGHAPMVNISLKPTSLYSRTRPLDFEGSLSGILSRLRPIYEEVIRAGGALTIDMESYQYKDITVELFKRLRGEYRDYPHLAIAMQAYLRETDRDIAGLIGWSRAEGLPVTIRLVKGAYWDYEIMRARQKTDGRHRYTPAKAETDAAFERLARVILENHDTAYLACGSHNIRSIASVLESARELKVPDNRYEFQTLYGMAEPVRKAVLKEAGRMRLYCPTGPHSPGYGVPGEEAPRKHGKPELPAPHICR